MDTNANMCNYALDKIGSAKQVTAAQLTANTVPLAKTCKRLYPQVYKEVLKRADWPEATKYAELTETEDSVEKGDWEYAFDLPNDYLGRAHLILEEYHRSTKPRHLIEFDKKIIQEYLLCNELTNSDDDAAYIQYIYNLTDVTKFNDLLVEAVALKLGAELATSVLKDKGARRVQLLQEYEDLVLPLAIGEAYHHIGDNEDKGEYTAITCRVP